MILLPGISCKVHGIQLYWMQNIKQSVKNLNFTQEFNGAGSKMSKKRHFTTGII